VSSVNAPQALAGGHTIQRTYESRSLAGASGRSSPGQQVRADPCVGQTSLRSPRRSLRTARGRVMAFGVWLAYRRGPWGTSVGL